MNKRLGFTAMAIIGAALAVLAAGPAVGDEPHVVAPPGPAMQAATADGPQTVVFAGGCFWGVQAVFQHVKGVESAVSGYSGGTTVNPGYAEVSSGRTGHAESVEVRYDPATVSFGRLMQIFFSVALDPTEVNRQGPDVGTQYRSAIFTTSRAQQRAATAYIDELDAKSAFPRPIATEVKPLGAFYRAESYHQDYATRHPYQPYIAINDLPKVAALKELFPDDYRPAPVLVGQAPDGE